MKLLKAIEIGELNIKEAGNKMPADTLTALKILIEAAKLIRDVKGLRAFCGFYRLPGEDI